MPSRRGFKLTQEKKSPRRRLLRGLLAVVGFTSVFLLAAAGTGASQALHRPPPILPSADERGGRHSGHARVAKVGAVAARPAAALRCVDHRD